MTETQVSRGIFNLVLFIKYSNKITIFRILGKTEKTYTRQPTSKQCKILY